MQLLGPHHETLTWFADHAGYTGRRPERTPSGLRITDPQSGIWKPGKSWPVQIPYAVSVWQSASGAYADEEPIFWPDGSWTYVYHQQGHDLTDPKSLYTNAGLFACMSDHVPVGVVIPAGDRSGRYRVLGLAYVDRWRNGFFVLSGPAEVGNETQAGIGQGTAGAATMVAEEPARFDFESPDDLRRRVLTSVVQRQGQSDFRRRLLCAYEGSCAVSAYDAEDALEAAHIVAYRGPASNHTSNGLLLRADLHTLFDLGLFAIDTDSMSVLLADGLVGTRYERFGGARLQVPQDPALGPDLRALQKHREIALL